VRAPAHLVLAEVTPLLTGIAQDDLYAALSLVNWGEGDSAA
jgi:hypothetical protein